MEAIQSANQNKITAKDVVKVLLNTTILLGFALYVLAATKGDFSAMYTPTLATVAVSLLGGGLGGYFLWGFFLMFRAVGRAGAQAGKAIATPPPNPAQIHVQLRFELGREPTIAEVASVYQMLSSQHNRNVTTAVGGFALAALITHQV